MYKILIADDEIKIRETLKDYLTAKGFSVTLAKDGETAVYSAETESFDLVILDVMMPKKDGLTACKEIREFTDIPILFLSALGEEENLLRGYRFGGDDYIVKPFPLSVLCEKITAMIKRHKGLYLSLAYRICLSRSPIYRRFPRQIRKSRVGTKECRLPHQRVPRAVAHILQGDV